MSFFSKISDIRMTLPNGKLYSVQQKVHLCFHTEGKLPIERVDHLPIYALERPENVNTVQMGKFV